MMPLTGRFFNFFIYSNLFIAGCAVLMVNQTYQLLLHAAPDLYFTAFVFFSTICSYNFHWYLSTPSVLSSPRIEWQRRHHQLHLVFFITGLAGSVIFFFYLLPSLAMVVTFSYHYFFIFSSQDSLINVSGH